MILQTSYNDTTFDYYTQFQQNADRLTSYLKLFEENLGESLPEVRRTEDGLDDDHSSVSRVDQQVSVSKNTT